MIFRYNLKHCHSLQEDRLQQGRDILWQTAFMFFNLIMGDNCVLPSLIAKRWVGPRLNDGSLHNLFQMISALLSISVVELNVVVFVVFLCSGFRSPLSQLLCFITTFLFYYMCFTVMFHR